ncbi:BMC domain-containing protein [Velocimicrobium porci]|uniref:BMC domain-containing protein n=1 Tax=Velocimicrobium porci TaxID=2606634 RepID=A0A6L5Y1T7_9FIRM|nr:BMC domain-containing protein [Velocimicrobium porci]MSS64962.1 BMC domain-containing protein [Velocimicrobium porci]
MKALGMIEVYGKLAAVEALDSALKAANVELVDVTRVGGGLVTVMIAGDVGATKAAIDAAEASAARVGRVISVHVIPRPSEDVGHMVARKETKENLQVEIEEQEETITEDKEEITEDKVLEQINEEIEEPTKEETQPKALTEIKQKKEVITKESLQNMTVANLRSLARQLEITNMTRKQIRFATKEDLVRSISEFLEQE